MPNLTKSQEVTSQYLLLRGAEEVLNPPTKRFRVFRSPVEGDSYCFVDSDGDVYLGPNLTSVADNTLTYYSDVLDFNEIAEAVATERVPRARHTVWHPPICLSALLAIWCTFIAMTYPCWLADAALAMAILVVLETVSVVLLFGRYRGPFHHFWRSR